jgi:hypothetical protein
LAAVLAVDDAHAPLTGPWRSRRAHDEVVDAVLWLDALVDVIVTGEHDLHTVLDEQRLEPRPDVDGGSVRLPLE